MVEGWATVTMCSPPSSVVGTGLCMEGIEQNPIGYDLMAELAFRCGAMLPHVMIHPGGSPCKQVSCGACSTWE